MNERGIRDDPDYKLLKTERLCQGPVIGVARERIVLPNGHETEQDVVLLPDAVAIVPIEWDAGGRPIIVLVEQFRNPLRAWMHEIPAGLVDPHEDTARAAARELAEETGLRARRMSHLASLFQIPGTSGHRLHFYLAEDLEPGEASLDDAECIHVRRFPLIELAEGLLSGRPGSTPVVDSKTHLGVLHAYLRFAPPGGARRGTVEPEDRRT